MLVNLSSTVYGAIFTLLAFFKNIKINLHMPSRLLSHSKTIREHIWGLMGRARKLKKKFVMADDRNCCHKLSLPGFTAVSGSSSSEESCIVTGNPPKSLYS